MTQRSFASLALISLFSLAVTFGLQTCGRNATAASHQVAIGVLVNMLFLLLQFLIHWKVALFVGIVTPLFAPITGHLPPFLLWLVPFIILGNSLMIVAGHWWEDRRLLERIILPAVHKAAIIGLGAFSVYYYFDSEEIEGGATCDSALRIIMFQYLTAFGGSISCYLVLLLLNVIPDTPKIKKK